MTMKKILCAGGMLLVPSHEVVANNEPLNRVESRIKVSAQPVREQPRLAYETSYGIVREPLKEYPYIEPSKASKKKRAKTEPITSTKKMLQSGRKIAQSLPYRSVWRDESKTKIASASVGQSLISSASTQKAQAPLQVRHARKFNQSYLRQKSIVD